jgi:dCMP deaminase
MKDKDEYYFGVAEAISKGSTCPRLQVGCVLVSQDRIKSTGYNGAIAGKPHCEDVGCFIVRDHCVRAIHAERNVLDYAAWDIHIGDVLYCTHKPCDSCAASIPEILTVKYKNEYPIRALNASSENLEDSNRDRDVTASLSAFPSDPSNCLHMSLANYVDIQNRIFISCINCKRVIMELLA